MDKLILFTSSFPYGSKETYLEREIGFLSKAFSKVEIYPYYYNQGNTFMRKVPENVEVHKAALPIQKSKRILHSLKGVFKGARIGLFIKEFFSQKIYRSKTNFKSWIFTLLHYCAAVSSYQYDKVKKEENAVLYFYWGFGWSYVLLNFKQSGTNLSYIRLHGSEVYLERSNGYIPLRKQLFGKADFLLPISNNLAEYLNRRYWVNSEKILVSRLGVSMPEHFNREQVQKSEVIHLVSCSNIIKLKRIDTIVEALKFMEGTRVNWVHFGDGPEMNRIQRLIDSAGFKTIVVELAGRKSNTEVLNYYKNHDIDAFVNVSKHEGVPVSVMEAMSCFIPCIATNVGATDELINNDNGALLEEDFTIETLVNSLKSVTTESWKLKREKAYSHCNQYFNANTNYQRLSNILKSD